MHGVKRSNRTSRRSLCTLFLFQLAARGESLSWPTLKNCSSDLDNFKHDGILKVVEETQMAEFLQLDATWSQLLEHHGVWCTTVNMTTVTIKDEGARQFGMYGFIAPHTSKPKTETAATVTTDGKQVQLKFMECQLIGTSESSRTAHSLQFVKSGASSRLCLIPFQVEPTEVLLVNMVEDVATEPNPTTKSNTHSATQATVSPSNTVNSSGMVSSAPILSNGHKQAVTIGVAVALSLSLVPLFAIALVIFMRRRRKRVLLRPARGDLSVTGGPQLELEPFEPASTSLPASTPRQNTRTRRHHHPRYWASRSHPSVGSIPQPPPSIEPPSSAGPPSVAQPTGGEVTRTKRKKRKTVLVCRRRAVILVITALIGRVCFIAASCKRLTPNDLKKYDHNAKLRQRVGLEIEHGYCVGGFHEALHSLETPRTSSNEDRYLGCLNWMVSE